MDVYVLTEEATKPALEFLYDDADLDAVRTKEVKGVSEPAAVNGTSPLKVDNRSGKLCHLRTKEIKKSVFDGAFQLEGSYITLWLQEVHRFKSDHDKVKNFVSDAKEVVFESVMTDVPWAWTGLEEKGNIRYGTFAKDWVKHVRDAGLKLHIVHRAHELPSWLVCRAELMEHTDPGLPLPCGPIERVSMGFGEDSEPRDGIL